MCTQTYIASVLCLQPLSQEGWLCVNIHTHTYTYTYMCTLRHIHTRVRDGWGWGSRLQCYTCWHYVLLCFRAQAAVVGDKNPSSSATPADMCCIVSGHKPRWLGTGILILGLGAFLYALPHFTAGIYSFQSSRDHNLCHLKVSCPNNEKLQCIAVKIIADSLRWVIDQTVFENL